MNSRECPSGTVCIEQMCRHAMCEMAVDCGDDQVCVRPRVSEFGLDADADADGRCAAGCRSARDCRAAAGYVCKNLRPEVGACLLEGPQMPGQRCTRSEDCQGAQACIAGPGGYCAVIGCEAGGCPEGSACATLGGRPMCLATCVGPGGCRVAEGYTCEVGDLDRVRVCMPPVPD
jgi:hypothetical protein